MLRVTPRSICYVFIEQCCVALINILPFNYSFSFFLFSFLILNINVYAYTFTGRWKPVRHSSCVSVLCVPSDGRSVQQTCFVIVYAIAPHTKNEKSFIQRVIRFLFPFSFVVFYFSLSWEWPTFCRTTGTNDFVITKHRSFGRFEWTESSQWFISQNKTNMFKIVFFRWVIDKLYRVCWKWMRREKNKDFSLA